MHDRLLNILLASMLVLLLVACDKTQAPAAQATAATQDFTLKLAETWGPNHPIFGETTKQLGGDGGADVGGRLRITIDSATSTRRRSACSTWSRPGSTTWGTPRPTTGKAKTRTRCISPICRSA